jgi:hypothetical protein
MQLVSDTKLKSVSRPDFTNGPAVFWQEYKHDYDHGHGHDMDFKNFPTVEYKIS